MEYSSAMYEFFLENIQKIMLPEELIEIGLRLSRFELVALLVVEKQQGLPMSPLAQRLGIPMSTATGVVDRLVKMGLLKRDRQEDDRRVVVVFLTNEGKELAGTIQKQFHSIWSRVRSFITEEEFETALVILKKIMAGFQNESLEKTMVKSPLRKHIEIQ